MSFPTVEGADSHISDGQNFARKQIARTSLSTLLRRAEEEDETKKTRQHKQMQWMTNNIHRHIFKISDNAKINVPKSIM